MGTGPGAARKDRGFFSSRTAGRSRADNSRPPRQSARQHDDDVAPKDLRARLRRENRCFRCKKKGHWKAECPEKQPSKDGTVPAAFSGLTFLHTVEEESDWTAASWRDQLGEGLLTSRVVAAMAAESLEEAHKIFCATAVEHFFNSLSVLQVFHLVRVW